MHRGNNQDEKVHAKRKRTEHKEKEEKEEGEKEVKANGIGKNGQPGEELEPPHVD